MKKALNKSVLFKVAPRPGLEPGTYGLTENSRFTKPLFYAACSVVFNYV